MVHYVFTPWRDRQELLEVRRQFYPQHHTKLANAQSDAALRPTSTSASSGQTLLRTRNGARLQDEAADPSRQEQRRELDQLEQHEAVARVSMWMQRGSCPHLVESTALLMAAVLSDQQAAATTTTVGKQEQPQGLLVEGWGGSSPRAPSSGSVLLSSSTYAARAAYSTAFSRFVTGLLDSHQERQHKMSMYAIAKSVGLPATFVELRHQATHEQLPSLLRLRSAARGALDWIYDYYWKHLTDTEESSLEDDPSGLVPEADAINLGALINQYLDAADNSEKAALREQLLAEEYRSKTAEIALDPLKVSTQDSKKLRLLIDLVKGAMDDESMDLDEDVAKETSTGEPNMDRAMAFDAIKAEMEEFRHGLENLKDASRIEEPARHPSADDAGPDQQPGWYRDKEPWIPKPIGIV